MTESYTVRYIVLFACLIFANPALSFEDIDYLSRSSRHCGNVKEILLQHQDDQTNLFDQKLEPEKRIHLYKCLEDHVWTQSIRILMAKKLLEDYWPHIDDAQAQIAAYRTASCDTKTIKHLIVPLLEKQQLHEEALAWLWYSGEFKLEDWLKAIRLGYKSNWLSVINHWAYRQENINTLTDDSLCLFEKNHPGQSSTD